VEAQRQLDEPELSGLDPVRADLRLIEPDLAGFPPGEHVEETAERSAVRGPQAYRSRHPEQRLRLEKGLKSLVLIDPTQWQPGQAQAVPDEHRTGVWEITKFSGAVSRDRKAQLTENAEALLAALRQARERANHTAAPAVSIGREVFAFLLG
jgi:hypothetical protein